MSANTDTADAVAELVKQLPPHLTENFEKADQQLRQFYGTAPGVTNLLRMWLACGSPSQIRSEFESAVLDIKRRQSSPHAEGGFDEDDL